MEVGTISSQVKVRLNCVHQPTLLTGSVLCIPITPIQEVDILI